MTNPIQKIDFRSASVISLIAVNLVLLVFALVFQWSFFEIIFTFWIENVIIGILNIPKILMSKQQHPGHRPDTIGSKIFAVLFFCFHYAIFSLLHGLFIVVMFGKMQGVGSPSEIFSLGLNGTFFVGVVLLFLSHLISFFVNYQKKKEYEKYSPFQQMLRPYIRVFIVHAFVILGGFVALTVDNGITILMIAFMLVKIGVDLFSHALSHKDKD